MKRFFSAEKNTPALSMLPQRSSNELSLPQTTPPLQGSRSGAHSPVSPYARSPVEPTALLQQQQQQAYFELAAASNLYLQSVNPGAHSMQAPIAIAPQALTPPPPISILQQAQSSPLPSPGRMAQAQLGALQTEDSFSAVGAGPASAGTAGADTSALDRNDLHKVLRSLEGLLVGLDEYRELQLKMAKIEKKIAKSAADMSKIKSVKHVPSQVLGCAALHFDALNDADMKHAKLVQKEYESVNDACAKYFKRVAREERAYDELIESLDTKIKKAHASQEKNAKRAGPRAVEAHDKYIAQVSSLTNEITHAKASHAASTGSKTHAISLVVASAVGSLADARFRSGCEIVRKTGKEVGPLNSWLNFAVAEAMPDQQPADLDDEERGSATRLMDARAQAQAQAQAQIQAQMQAQAQATQAFAQAQLQSSAAALLAVQQQHRQGEETPVGTMRSIAPSVKAQAKQEPVQGVKFADLPQLDGEGRLIPTERPPSPGVATTDFRDASKSESKLRNVETESAATTSLEPRRPEAVRPGAAVSFEDEKMNPVEEDEDEDIDEDAESSHPGGAAVTVPSRPELAASHSSAKDAAPSSILRNLAAPAATATQLQRTSTASTSRSTGFSSDFKDESSIQNLAASLAVPGGDRQDREPSSSSKEDGSRRDESTSTPSLTNSTSRPGSEESALLASPRPLYASRNPAVMGEVDEKEAEEEALAHSREYDPTRYAPVVGQSRIASVSVSRTLSTDTTASERSFVARMKAKYQAEKEGLRQAALVPAQVVPPYRGPSPSDMPANTRRVSDLASQFSPRHSAPAGGFQAHQHQLSGMSGGVGRPRNGPAYGRDEMSSPPPLSSTATSRIQSVAGSSFREPAGSHYGTGPNPVLVSGARFRGSDQYMDRHDPGVNEFGSVKSSRSAIGPGAGPSGGSSLRPISAANSRFAAVDEQDEKPHSDVCGCQRCSARHYNEPGGDAGRPGAYSSSSYRSDRDPRMPSNIRRQTMPVQQGEPPSSSYLVTGRYDAQRGHERDLDRERERERAHSGDANYGTHFMRGPPSASGDRYGMSSSRDSRDGRDYVGSGPGTGKSAYGSHFGREDFGQGRLQPIR
ncbi:hypothetical protein V8E36_007919 [Tilletia maclaganii]